jgi:serine/threonine protein kinase
MSCDSSALLVLIAKDVMQSIDDLTREVKILSVLKGKPNIVEFYGAYETSDNVYMVLEYVTSNLLSGRQRLPQGGTLLVI